MMILYHLICVYYELSLEYYTGADEYTTELVIVAFQIHCCAKTVYDADSVRSLNTCLFKLFVSAKIDAQLLMRH